MMEKLKPNISSMHNTHTHTHTITMITDRDFFVIAGSLAVIFAILFCGMKPTQERRYPRTKPRKIFTN